ncbi:hypothetical protein AGOR_G00021930 [Albula goreensis]|uniref:Thyroglobulin type-1 domain-containing protein n=1 Tax=Albula goreensis TaxID=1534307 RepID=A0A8T3E843_9TELE|nr:hypothetical protein AGOR_G00021930 [Albula goreensis]
MAEQHDEPLLAPAPTVVNMGQSESDVNKKAFKVAGFTVLACLLIAGQALTAYFLLNQKSQISSLEENTNSLQKELNRRPSAPSAAKTMHVPMYNMPMLIDETSEDKVPVPKPKGGPSVQTKCLMQVMRPGPGGFIPQCDQQGNYLPMQCWKSTGMCWCVDSNGSMIEGSLNEGPVNCAGMPRAPASLGRMAAMPSMVMDMAMEKKEE